MKRSLVILAAIAGISGAAWAIWRPAHTAAPAPAAATNAAQEPKTCCQKAPSRANLLTAKPAAQP